MSKFGWSYPPGCSGTPFDEPDPPCDICGRDTDECICPPCKSCEEIGNPSCYANHGMFRTEAQIKSLATESAKWAADAKRMEPD